MAARWGGTAAPAFDANDGENMMGREQQPSIANEAERTLTARRPAHTAEVMLWFRAQRYLIAGTICGLIGGSYSTYITYAYSNEYTRKINMLGEPFPSGNAYWPPSVSNMVNDINSPPGKVWLAFMVTSAMLTMVSWYPYQFPNVNVGEGVSLIPCWPDKPWLPSMSMNSARLFLPQIGMLMVTLVHTANANVWDAAQDATLIFHTGGAALWVGVTLYSEVYILAFSKVAVVGPTERALRWSCVALSLLAGVVYAVTQSGPPDDYGICCGNRYRPVTMEDVQTAKQNGAYAIAQQDLAFLEARKFTPDAAPPLYQGMYDTAYGWGLVWYTAEFWGEVLAGFFMLLDLLVIWFFARKGFEADTSLQTEPQV